jgi:hypothetical protein
MLLFINIKIVDLMQKLLEKQNISFKFGSKLDRMIKKH